jgi:hypothetical protein
MSIQDEVVLEQEFSLFVQHQMASAVEIARFDIERRGILDSVRKNPV